MENNRKPCWTCFWRRSYPNWPLRRKWRKKLWTTKYQRMPSQWYRRRWSLFVEWGSKQGNNWILGKRGSDQSYRSNNKIGSIHFGWNQQRVLDNKQKQYSRHLCYRQRFLRQKVHRRRKTRRVNHHHWSYAMLKK